MFENVSIIALVASGIAAMVIGYVWYGPLFGKSWMKEAHVSENDIKAAEKEMPKTYGLTFIASLVQAYVLSMFINYAGAIDYVSAATVAFWVWLGFVVTIRLYDTLFERKPTNLFGINIGYSLITFVVMSAILITL